MHKISKKKLIDNIGMTSMITYIIAIFCVLGLALGQVLFKMCAMKSLESETLLTPSILFLFFSTFAIYGTASILWIWILQKIELSRAYPIMALAFVFVPLSSHIIFGEQIHVQYMVGVALIILGVIFTQSI